MTGECGRKRRRGRPGEKENTPRQESESKCQRESSPVLRAATMYTHPHTLVQSFSLSLSLSLSFTYYSHRGIHEAHGLCNYLKP